MSDSETTSWNPEQQALIDLNQQIPLMLPRDGFAAYSAQFHPAYTNWYMGGARVRGRAEFLAAVEQWFQAGNHAVGSNITPLSVEIMGDTAYMRFVQEEIFNDAQGVESRFIGNFASLMRKEDGRWLFYATSFSEISRG